MKHLERRHLVILPSKEISVQAADVADRAEYIEFERRLLKDEELTYLSVLMVGVSMFTYSTDVASSAVACYWLYGTGRWWWWITTMPLIASLAVVNIFSIRWYLHDHHERKRGLPDVSISHWILRIMFHVVLLGPVVRYLELFLHGWQSSIKNDPNRRKHQLMFLQEDRDTSMLALVGSFIKSAPQLVLQLYILTQHKVPLNLPTIRSQAFNLVMSLVELSLSQCSYHRALRRSLPKKNMTKMGTVVQFCSHFCVISSRVLALAAFTSQYERWILLFCVVHWVLMTVWLVTQQTAFCATSKGEPRHCEELLFNVVLGVIYLFCFINIKDEPTRWKYTFYYIIIWIENTTLVVLWYVKADAGLWFHVPLIASVPSSLAAGLTFLLIYYQYLHPNKTWKKLSSPT